uniref:DUF4806 domain-containing protein n=1 Tax=Haemonchus placei TaxID=6290 RepID=A0A0N4WAV7_HAEPC
LNFELTIGLPKARLVAYLLTGTSRNAENGTDQNHKTILFKTPSILNYAVDTCFRKKTLKASKRLETYAEVVGVKN